VSLLEDIIHFSFPPLAGVGFISFPFFFPRGSSPSCQREEMTSPLTAGTDGFPPSFLMVEPRRSLSPPSSLLSHSPWRCGRIKGGRTGPFCVGSPNAKASFFLLDLSAFPVAFPFLPPSRPFLAECFLPIDRWGRPFWQRLKGRYDFFFFLSVAFLPFFFPFLPPPFSLLSAAAGSHRPLSQRSDAASPSFPPHHLSSSTGSILPAFLHPATFFSGRFRCAKHHRPFFFSPRNTQVPHLVVALPPFRVTNAVVHFFLDRKQFGAKSRGVSPFSSGGETQPCAAVLLLFLFSLSRLLKKIFLLSLGS